MKTLQINVETFEKAMKDAFILGQIYWQQADSCYTSQQMKSDATHEKFLSLIQYHKDNSKGTE